MDAPANEPVPQLKRYNTPSAEVTEALHVVSIAFKIWMISDVDPMNRTFKCKFRVFLEWLDENAVGLPEGKKATKEQFDKVNVPNLSIQNCLTFTVLDQSSKPEVVNSENGHVAYQVLYQATVQMRFDMTLFPFDSQWLYVVMSLRHKKDQERTFFLQYCDVDENLHLEEWEICRTLHSSYSKLEMPDERECAFFGILVQRSSQFYTTNVMLMLCLITSLCFLCFVLGVSELVNRGKIMMSIMPSLVLFRLSTDEKVPKVPYFTTFDTYAASCFVLFWVIALGNVAVATLSAGPAAGAARTLEAIIGSIAGLLWILWNLWFVVRVRLFKKLDTEDVVCAPIFLSGDMNGAATGGGTAIDEGNGSRSAPPRKSLVSPAARVGSGLGMGILSPRKSLRKTSPAPSPIPSPTPSTREAGEQNSKRDQTSISSKRDQELKELKDMAISTTSELQLKGNLAEKGGAKTASGVPGQHPLFTKRQNTLALVL